MITEFTPDPKEDYWCVYGANVENGETTKVKTSQFYHRDGFLQLECSDSLPAELMVQAIHAAWKVLEPTCQQRLT